MPRLERSAGFILFRTVPEARRLYLLLDYGRHWDYVKGHVEKGEDDLAAAIRELYEETGLPEPRVIEGFNHPVEYRFTSSRHGLIHKHVVFFLGETKQSKIILSEEHVGSAFLPFDEAMERLTYPTARDVLAAADAFLNRAV